MKNLCVFLLAVVVRISTLEHKCKQELIDSHNIMSFMEPGRAKLVLCPHIRQSCCPSFEQFKIFDKYEKIIKPHYDLLNEVIKIELRMLDKLFNGIVDNMLKKVTSIEDEGARIMSIDLLQRLKKKKIGQIVKTAIKQHANTHRYLINMKTSYFCVICDYNNHANIDTVRRRFAITDSSCDDIVKNTIVYANAINRGIIPFIESLTRVHQKISKKEKTLRLAGSTHISKAVKECADEYKVSDENLTSCRKYCSYFRLNADSPAMEGYPEFFANVLMELKDYQGGGSAPANPKSRVLAEKMGKLLKSTRRLKESNSSGDKGFNDPFDPNKPQPIDLFEPNSVDSDFDDAAMMEAFRVQQLLTKGEAFDSTSVVRKHYIDEYEVPMDDIESPNVFNTPSQSRVDVSEYKGEVLVAGIDYPTILKDINWNMTVDEIAKALVTGKRAGKKETVDPTLIVAINDIDNKYVKKFHRDVFLDFKRMRFSYRANQLRNKGLDSLLANKKNVTETLSFIKEIVKSNESDKAVAEKLIKEITKRIEGADKANTINDKKDSTTNNEKQEPNDKNDKNQADKDEEQTSKNEKTDQTDGKNPK